MALLANVETSLYTRNDSPYFHSSIGKHMRHLLDYYECFCNGYRKRIDYDDRHRDKELEQSCARARKRIGEVMHALERLVADPALTRLTPAAVTHDDIGLRSAGERYDRSTIGRELQFLIGHTVHHYAQIAIILRVFGFEPPSDFGYAPSTLLERKKEAQKEEAQKEEAQKEEAGKKSAGNQTLPPEN